MATNSDPIFVDTNVLIYSKLALSPFQPVAEATLQKLAADGVQIWISRQVMREYLAGMTRPGVLTGAVAASALAADVRSFADQFFVAEDGPAITDHLIDLLTSIPVAGRQVHDANIVATAMAYSIPRLLTHNVIDSQRFSHLVTLVPLVPVSPPSAV